MRIVEVTIRGVIFQERIVGIWVGTVATAIDITTDAGVNAYGIAKIDSASHIIATIYIVDITTLNDYTCRQVRREIKARYVTHDARDVLTCVRVLGMHVGHTATAIDIIYHKCGGLRDVQEDAIGVSHVALVTAAVEVTYLAA